VKTGEALCRGFYFVFSPKTKTDQPVEKGEEHLSGMLPGGNLRSLSLFLGHATKCPGETLPKVLHLFFHLLGKHRYPPGLPERVSLHQRREVALSGDEIFRKPEEPKGPEKRRPQKKSAPRRGLQRIGAEKLFHFLEGKGEGRDRKGLQRDFSASIRLLSEKRGGGKRNASPGGEPERVPYQRSAAGRCEKPRLGEMFRKRWKRGEWFLPGLFPPEIEDAFHKGKMDSPHADHLRVSGMCAGDIVSPAPKKSEK
jgi:hypothetical protein